MVVGVSPEIPEVAMPPTAPTVGSCVSAAEGAGLVTPAEGSRGKEELLIKPSGPPVGIDPTASEPSGVSSPAFDNEPWALPAGFAALGKGGRLGNVDVDVGCPAASAAELSCLSSHAGGVGSDPPPSPASLLFTAIAGTTRDSEPSGPADPVETGCESYSLARSPASSGQASLLARTIGPPPSADSVNVLDRPFIWFWKTSRFAATGIGACRSPRSA